MKITLFLKDTNCTDIISLKLSYHFSMFGKISIRCDVEDLKQLAIVLIMNKIKFEYEAPDTININPNYVNFRIDKIKE